MKILFVVTICLFLVACSEPLATGNSARGDDPQNITSERVFNLRADEDPCHNKCRERFETNSLICGYTAYSVDTGAVSYRGGTGSFCDCELELCATRQIVNDREIRNASRLR